MAQSTQLIPLDCSGGWAMGFNGEDWSAYPMSVTLVPGVGNHGTKGYLNIEFWYCWFPEAGPVRKDSPTYIMRLTLVSELPNTYLVYSDPLRPTWP